MNKNSTRLTITGDSSWDMPYGLLGERGKGFVTVPFNIIMGDRQYLDGVDVQIGDLFDYKERTGCVPKTAANPPSVYEEVFARELRAADAIIHISLSSEISTCHRNACIAAGRFRNVYVIDGRSLSSALALLAMYAADLHDEGLPAVEIAEKVEERTHKLQCSFVIDELEYLHKGGRCGGVARFASSLLKIKPTIIMDGGLTVGKKYVGAGFKSALSKYVDDVFERCPNPDLKRIFIVYSTAAPDIVDMVRDKVASLYKFEEVYVCHTGCTITTHCGPNTLGIGYFFK